MTLPPPTIEQAIEHPIAKGEDLLRQRTHALRAQGEHRPVRSLARTLP
jgi:hypothetical protein